MANRSVFQCFCHPPESCFSSQCLSNVGCYYSVELSADNKSIISETYGCISNNSIKLCPIIDYKIVRCCADGSSQMCNKEIGIEFKSLYFSSSLELVLSVILPVSFFLLTFAVIFLIFRLSFKKIYIDSRQKVLNFISRKDAKMYEVPRFERKEFESGSGYGLPFLVKTTIGRQINLRNRIGQGRFGEVWTGEFVEEMVAVKIFKSRDEYSWNRETEVYTKYSLSHPNILSFYASDIISKKSITQLWLITAYHSRGSLYDFLTSTDALNLLDGFRLIKSAVFGLSYLHLKIENSSSKPAIAHRDIKSKNLLVKDDGEVCVADLGLALMNEHDGIEKSKQNWLAAQKKMNRKLFFGVGTKRYMSPELLLLSSVFNENSDNCSYLDLNNKNVYSPNFKRKEIISQELHHLSEIENEEWFLYMKDILQSFVSKPPSCINFEIFLSSDVYALSLVAWEILNRTLGFNSQHEILDKYKIPYENLVSSDPTFHEMKNVVIYGVENSHKNKTINRPEIPSRCFDDDILHLVSDVISNGWCMDWRRRLTISDMKRKFIEIDFMIPKNMAEISDVLRKSC